MTGLKQVYRCNVCGNIIEVLHTGKGVLQYPRSVEIRLS